VKLTALSVVLALAALAAGIVIGRYTVSSVTPAPVQTTAITPASPATPYPAVVTRPVRTTEEAKKEASPANPEDVVAAIKNALSHVGSRRGFAEFGKLSELINEKNLGEVLAFAESLPKAQD
jgi:hypothetical protein